MIVFPILISFRTVTRIQNDISPRVIQASLVSTYLSGLGVQPELENKCHIITGKNSKEIVKKKYIKNKKTSVTIRKADGERESENK